MSVWQSGPMLGAERVARFERTIAVENRLAKAQATDIVDLPWGFAVLQRDFPKSHFHNRIVVTSEAPVSEILAAAEEVLGGAELGHRYLSFDEAFWFADESIATRLSEELVRAGYEHETILTMAYEATDNAGSASTDSPDHQVHEVPLATLRPALMKNWRTELPDSDDDAIAQLADRTSLYFRGADVALLAVYEGEQIAAHAMWFIDRATSVSQFENLNTHPEFRGKGYAGALIRHARQRSQDAGSDLCFLTADLDDWPREWYQRFGYAEIGRSHHFTRTL